ncbi:hypothetical protein C8J57DRAFT_1315264 [Mycena rebaudengoi]|nr:hypothetical protein C8J57DRAFT_1315264 [Mycena rebaudengoi]
MGSPATILRPILSNVRRALYLDGIDRHPHPTRPTSVFDLRRRSFRPVGRLLNRPRETPSMKAVPAMCRRRTNARKSYAHTSVRDPVRPASPPPAFLCLADLVVALLSVLLPLLPACRRPPTASPSVEQPLFVCEIRGQATGRIDDSTRRPKDALRPNTLAGNAHRFAVPDAAPAPPIQELLPTHVDTLREESVKHGCHAHGRRDMQDGWTVVRMDRCRLGGRVTTAPSRTAFAPLSPSLSLPC